MPILDDTDPLAAKFRETLRVSGTFGGVAAPVMVYPQPNGSGCVSVQSDERTVLAVLAEEVRSLRMDSPADGIIQTWFLLPNADTRKTMQALTRHGAVAGSRSVPMRDGEAEDVEGTLKQVVEIMAQYAARLG